MEQTDSGKSGWGRVIMVESGGRDISKDNI